MPGIVAERASEQVIEGAEIDRERWGRLFEQYHPWVLRQLKVRLSDHALAEDLASEVFIRLGVSLATLDPAQDDRLYGWLTKVYRGMVVNHWRSARYQREELARPSEDATGSEHDRAACDALSCPEDIAAQKAEVRRLLALLPASEREALALHALEDLTTAEVADRMGVSARTVRNRLHAAMDVLRPVMRTGPTWEDAARNAVLAEAETGRPFTSRDLTAAYNLAATNSRAQWNALLCSLRKEGVIRPLEINGDNIRVWVGAKAEVALNADAMAVAA